MKKIKYIFLLMILFFGFLLIFIITKERIKTQYEATFTPVFQILGLTTKTIDRALTRIIPVDSIDEKDFGDAIRLRYENNLNKNDKDYIYLNDLISNLEMFKRKPFKYSVYLIDYDEPNAFAMPGGVILVTKGLLNTLDSESELASILAHEMGHIEMSHCFDLVRFELLTKKIKNESLGYLADLAINLLVHDSFSKTLENDADDYSYNIILKTKYDPLSLSNSFNKFKDYEEKYQYIDDKKEINPIRDYFTSHPPIELRVEKFNEAGIQWWKIHKTEKRYVGKNNFKNRISLAKKDYGNDEWMQVK